MNFAHRHALTVVFVGLLPVQALAQSFRVQCPTTTSLHPGACSGGTNAGQACKRIADCPDKTGVCVPPGSAIDPSHPGQIKCQHVGGGDGYATMGDGNQIYLFAFSPLSGLADIEAGLAGTQTAKVSAPVREAPMPARIVGSLPTAPIAPQRGSPAKVSLARTSLRIPTMPG